MERLYAVVIFAVLLTELHAVAPAFPSKRQAWAPRPQPSGGEVPTQGREAGADEERGQINSVAVSCSPDSLEIVIQADLFGVGAPVRSSDVRLGVDNDDERCRATESSSEEHRITVGLLDCGTKHWMTQDSLVYTNLLIYSPEPPTGGVVRMEEAVIPIECHYNRKYSLSSPALSPTWVPFVSTVAAVEKLYFDLRIMTPDWVYKRGSNVFFLGEDINIEASVRRGHHTGLRVFLSTCVATLTPDEHSLPRFVFIEDGCLLDSQLPHSRSQFLSRVQDDKLHLVLDAFRFHNADRAELYITCHVTAVPVHDADAPNKACTFVNGRWRSADGNDYLCGHCQTQNEEGPVKDKVSSQFRPRGFGGPEIPEHLWRSGQKTEQVSEIDKAKVGPILVLPTEQTTEPELDPHTYGSVWRSGLNQKTDYADGNNTLKEATNDLEFSEKLAPQVVHVQENETTPAPGDILTTPVYNITISVYNITTSVNDTDSDRSDANDPKR
uniref:Zona pellucida sperm-binding protein 3 n=1 Tax=Neogobius melanostomus TaxID=47308 RepID=A0A8C6U669_9GOBI